MAHDLFLPFERTDNSRLMTAGTGLVEAALLAGLAGVGVISAAAFLAFRRSARQSQLTPLGYARRRLDTAWAAVSAGADVWRGSDMPNGNGSRPARQALHRHVAVGVD